MERKYTGSITQTGLIIKRNEWKGRGDTELVEGVGSVMVKQFTEGRENCKKTVMDAIFFLSKLCTVHVAR